MTLFFSDLRAFHQSCRALLIILLSPTIAGAISHFVFLCTRKHSVVRSLFSSIIVVVESLDNHNVVDFDHDDQEDDFDHDDQEDDFDHDDHDDEYDNHVLLADSTWRPNTRALATRLSSWRARSSSPSTSSHLLIFLCWFSSTTMLSTICLT